MGKFTFLSESDIYDKTKMLNIIRKKGSDALVTDFARALGISDYWMFGRSGISGVCGSYWTKTPWKKMWKTRKWLLLAICIPKKLI